MATPDRFVVFDDSETTRIQFGDGWVSVTPDQSINGLGNFGIPFRNSLHALRQDGSFTFKFNGSSIDIYGTTTRSRSSTGDDPSYECIIDNISMKINTPLLSFDENNWSLCSTSGLAIDREHTMEMKIKVSGNIFYFDRLQYNPSSDADFNATGTALFDSRHASVTYDSSWEEKRGIVNSTNNNGGKATISFVGKSLSWFGVVPGPDPPIAQTSATYAVDNGIPVQFLLRGLPTGGMEQFNQQFFQTPQLSQGPHTVEVVYGGNSNTTPLVLDYYIVEHDVIPPSPSNATSNGGGDSGSGNHTDPMGSTKHSKGAPVGAIVGAIIGALALISVIALVILFQRRRKANLHRNGTIDTHMGECGADPNNFIPPSSTAYPHTAVGLLSPPFNPMSQEVMSHSSMSILSRSPPSTTNSADNASYSTGQVYPYSSLRSQGVILPPNKNVRAMGHVTRPEESLVGSYASGESPVVVKHQDSGQRLNFNVNTQPSQGQRVVERPPTYTPA